jgi:hypothetical protein
VSEYDDIVRGRGHTGQAPKRKEQEPPGLTDDEIKERLASLSSEELKELAGNLGVDVEAEAPASPEELAEKVGFVRASSLVENPEELDTGDWEPGGKYKGFEVLPREEWPSVSDVMPDPEKGIVGHANQARRFYVVSATGMVGLVPWDGSQIIWPWEAAWRQDMHRTSVESFLKEEPKKKERK